MPQVNYLCVPIRRGAGHPGIAGARGLVEGRKPILRVAASVLEATGNKAADAEKVGRSEEYCMALATDPHQAARSRDARRY